MTFLIFFHIGGYGTVYRAQRTTDGKRVAIKCKWHLSFILILCCVFSVIIKKRKMGSVHYLHKIRKWSYLFVFKNSVLLVFSFTLTVETGSNSLYVIMLILLILIYFMIGVMAFKKFWYWCSNIYTCDFTGPHTNAHKNHVNNERSMLERFG